MDRRQDGCLSKDSESRKTGSMYSDVQKSTISIHTTHPPLWRKINALAGSFVHIGIPQEAADDDWSGLELARVQRIPAAFARPEVPVSWSLEMSKGLEAGLTAQPEPSSGQVATKKTP